jgi:ABC-type transport system involved in cytochrome c biogenesis permease component
MAVQTRTRDMLLPILLFPVIIPGLGGGGEGIQRIFAVGPFDEIRPWINLLIWCTTSSSLRWHLWFEFELGRVEE